MPYDSVSQPIEGKSGERKRQLSGYMLALVNLNWVERLRCRKVLEIGMRKLNLGMKPGGGVGGGREWLR